MEGTREREKLIASPRCPYCHEDVSRGEAIRVCEKCHAFHHGACWRELGGCAACGAERRPEPVPRVAIQGVTRASVEERQRLHRRRRRLIGLTALLIAFGAGAWDVSSAVHKRPPSEPTAVGKASPGSTELDALYPERDGRFPLNPLSPTWTEVPDAPNVRFRLLAGLEAAWPGASSWTSRELRLKVERATFASPAECLHQVIPRLTAPEIVTRAKVATIGGHQAVFVQQADEDLANVAVAIDLGPDSLVFLLRGPAGTAEKLERLLRASVETIVVIPPPLAQPPLPLARQDVGEGFTALVPPHETGEGLFVFRPTAEIALEKTTPDDLKSYGELLTKVHSPGTLLPWRALCVRHEGSERRFFLLAAGTVDGRAIQATATGVVDAGADGAALVLRLTAMVDSVEPEPK
jgi:hypothetical protein